MLKGSLTKEQIGMIMNMIQLAGDKNGVGAYPALGELVKALSDFKQEET